MCKQALSLFNEMRRARVGLDQVPLVAALSACAGLCDLKLGKWIHPYIEETLCLRREPLLVSLNNALIPYNSQLLEINNSDSQRRSIFSLKINLYPKFQRRQNARIVKLIVMNANISQMTTSGIPTMLIGNGSDVLINLAFRTAIKDEVTLTLEKAENEVLGHDVVNTIIQRKLTRTVVGDGSIEVH
ncbi:hypothetical protein QYF36_008601 [Acer negundo]|nr:hypothetical protein QYF36_008601 [Acer negundo]